MITLVSPFPTSHGQLLWEWMSSERNLHFDDYGPGDCGSFELELNRRIRDEFTWGVYRGEELIGYIGALIHSPMLASLHGVVIDPKFRGKGMGSNAIKAIVEYLKGDGISKVMANFFSDNWGIERTFTKLGGVQEGLFTGFTMRGGELTDMKVWSLT